MASTPKKPRRSKTDPWLEGAYVGPDKTPEDFRLDPETGLRRNGKEPDGSWRYESKPPFGSMRLTLEEGQISGRFLPPMETWSKGFWLSDEKDVCPEVAVEGIRWKTWVVDGEGCPGNYRYRLYELPQARATQVGTPLHPSKWPKPAEKKTGYSYGESWQQKSSLPLNLRIRCQGCGHWYKEDDLKDHITSACPGMQGGTTEWIMPCGCCVDMDVTAVCKEGFPRKPKVTAPAEVKVEVPADPPVTA